MDNRSPWNLEIINRHGAKMMSIHETYPDAMKEMRRARRVWGLTRYRIHRQGDEGQWLNANGTVFDEAQNLAPSPAERTTR